jgi:GDSL-like Lipase/Acylhydrolase family
MHMFRRLAVSAIVAAAGLAFSAPSAVAQPSVALSTIPLPGPVLDVDAHPALDWSVPSRYDASWAAWNPVTLSYDKNFVNPAGWSLDLDACASASRYRITGYSISLEQLGKAWKWTHTTSSCQVRLHDLLPAQGLYAATLTLRTSAGVSVPLRRIVGIKDELIVSMGDSMASGEGNPDTPGAYNVSYFEHVETSVSTVRAAVWQDQRCHRSARSGPALAAKALEDADPKTSVTFLSVACSGAELDNLIDTAYGGIAPIGSTKEEPQVPAIAAATGPVSNRPARPIDALLVTAGVNDLHFSDIIYRCSTNVGDDAGCVTSGGIAGQVQALPQKFAKLAAVIRQELPATREVYVSDYPDNPFDGGGCGALGLPKIGITPAEASEMATWGTALDDKISDAARTFRRAPYNWNELDLDDVPFGSHAYCSKTPWFVKYDQSWEQQGDKKGTAHPNALGAQAWAAQIRRLVVPDQIEQPYRRLTITINALKLPAVTGVPPASVPVTLYEYQNDLVGLTHYISVPRNGQWKAVLPSQGTFYLDVYPAPSSPRHATSLYISLDYILPIIGTLNNGYAAGHHVLEHPAGKLSVDYTVTLAPSASAGGSISH